MSSPLASQVTHGIRVNVRGTFLADESSPQHQYHVFAYQVEIVNESNAPVKLISREWHIIDGLGSRREVIGDGVIGQQPLIAPGEFHRYVSGTHFQTAVGQMRGYYYMEDLMHLRTVRVIIPPFTLIAPFILN